MKRSRSRTVSSSAINAEQRPLTTRVRNARGTTCVRNVKGQAVITRIRRASNGRVDHVLHLLRRRMRKKMRMRKKR